MSSRRESSPSGKLMVSQLTLLLLPIPKFLEHHKFFVVDEVTSTWTELGKKSDLCGRGCTVRGVIVGTEKVTLTTDGGSKQFAVPLVGKAVIDAVDATEPKSSATLR
jgi:hypothetical protein